LVIAVTLEGQVVLRSNVSSDALRSSARTSALLVHCPTWR
jgi:hypothetical protein